MRFLSVCSGIEAASVAWEPLGWKAVAFSEIEPFPCAVLAHHYHDTPNWGDMTKYKDWPDVSIDLLCGGTPCQSFSVAGLRKGLDDPRGNLMLTFGAIAAKYRPQWLVWENVPGVLSSNGGADFGAFLGMLGQLGYGFAYRVFDAQYFGTPINRRRVFVVGCAGSWHSAAAVLFERSSIEDLRKKTSGVPCIDASGLAKKQTMPDKGRCWTVHDGHGHRFLTPREVERLFGFPDDYTAIPRHAARQKKSVHARAAQGLESHDAIQVDGGGGSGNGLAPGRLVRDMREGNEPCLCGSQSHDRNGSRSALPSLQCGTPCNRKRGLFGKGDGVPKEVGIAADGPRYKALGNSWAVPNVRWIGQRIDAVALINKAQAATKDVAELEAA